MAQYPIKMLKDENGNPFVPLVAPEGVINTDSENLNQMLADKISEPASDGTAGQVLTTDGVGGRAWTTVQGGGGGTSDYTALSNKPQINSTTLSGNKSPSDLGLQDTLVSGTNIKTINNTSILGSGDISVVPSLDYAVYEWDGTSSSQTPGNITLFQNILDDHNNGKTVLIARSPIGGMQRRSEVFVFDTSIDTPLSTSTEKFYILDATPYNISNSDTSYTTTTITYTRVTIYVDPSDITVVTGVTKSNYNVTEKYLNTDVDYATVYTPAYNGSPATKKYVDDSAQVAVSATEPTATNAEIWIDPTETPTQAPIQIDTYNTTESTTNKIWIDGKPVYRKVVNFGALPNNTYSNVAHNISNMEQITDIKAIGKDTNSNFYMINFQGTASMYQSNTFAIRVNTTNITISTTADYSTHTAYVILEYTKTTD